MIIKIILRLRSALISPFYYTYFLHLFLSFYLLPKFIFQRIIISYLLICKQNLSHVNSFARCASMYFQKVIFLSFYLLPKLIFEKLIINYLFICKQILSEAKSFARCASMPFAKIIFYLIIYSQKLS